MTIEVEDGTGLEGANSYVSIEDANAYADDHGLTFSNDEDVAGPALIRASTAIDATYKGAYPGYRSQGRTQGLEWPRASAYDSQGWLIPDDEVPKEIIAATIEAAVRELAKPGVMMPDLKRGGGIQSIRAGSVGLTYAANATARTTFTLIDGLLSNILVGTTGSGGGLFGDAIRG